MHLLNRLAMLNAATLGRVIAALPPKSQTPINAQTVRNLLQENNKCLQPTIH